LVKSQNQKDEKSLKKDLKKYCSKWLGVDLRIVDLVIHENGVTETVKYYVAG